MTCGERERGEGTEREQEGKRVRESGGEGASGPFFIVSQTHLAVAR